MAIVILRNFERHRFVRELMTPRVLPRGRILRRRGKRMDRGDEPVAMAGDGHDVIVLIGALMQRPPQRGDLANEIVFLYGCIGPHKIQQLILADDTVSTMKQDDQNVECLGRDWYRAICVA
jgi:hypothetical protein